MRRLALLPFVLALALTTPAHAQTPYPLPAKDFPASATLLYIPARADGQTSSTDYCLDADGFDAIWGVFSAPPPFQSQPVASFGYISAWAMDGQLAGAKPHSFKYDVTVFALTVDTPDHAAALADDYILAAHAGTPAKLLHQTLPAGIRAISQYQDKQKAQRFIAGVSGSTVVEVAAEWHKGKGYGKATIASAMKVAQDALAANL